MEKSALKLNKTQKTQEIIVQEGLNALEEKTQEHQFYEFNIKGFERVKTGDKIIRDHITQLVVNEFRIKEFQAEPKLILQMNNKSTFGNKHMNTSQLNQLKLSEQDKKLMGNYLHYSWFKKKLLIYDVNTLVLNFIYLKTGGSPLLVINFVLFTFQQFQIKELFRGQFIKTLFSSLEEPNIAYISEKFKDILMLEEPFTVNVPIDRLRVNHPIIDKYNIFKLHTRLECLELLLMKVASVIGDIFDIQTLFKIQPFKDQITNDKILKILTNLENQNIIEILEMNDLNIYYRFAHPFLRECFYQRLIYSQRREIHRNVAQAMQEIPQQFEFDEEKDSMKLEYHWALAEDQDKPENNNSNSQKVLELSHKAKRSMIVKQIQSILSKNKNNQNVLLIKGILEKKSDANVTWAERFCTMSGKDLRYYYTETDYKEKYSNPLGIIPLKAIYGIMPFKEGENTKKPFAFQISSSSWQKKNQEMEERKFYFAAKNEDLLEEWIIYLEFTRAKAIYDDFVNNFGKIQFPLGDYQDHIDASLGYEITNFGKHIKIGGIVYFKFFFSRKQYKRKIGIIFFIIIIKNFENVLSVNSDIKSPKQIIKIDFYSG